MEYKLIKLIRILEIIIIALTIFVFIFMAYNNLNSIRKSTSQLDKGINEIIIQDMVTYQNDVKELKEIKGRLAESEARIDKIFKEAGIND